MVSNKWWLGIQMVAWIPVRYSDACCHDTGIWIMNHLNTEQVKVWKPDWKSLFMVQNVQYLNGLPSHVTLPFEFRTPILFSIRWIPYSGVQYSDGYCTPYYRWKNAAPRSTRTRQCSTTTGPHPTNLYQNTRYTKNTWTCPHPLQFIPHPLRQRMPLRLISVVILKTLPRDTRV